MRFGSLFSGIGGLDLGLERAGMTCVWQSEIDPYCSKVLAKHWPNTPNLGDINGIEWNQVPAVDVICGGYPCQPFSLAGVRRGEHDERHLWPRFFDAVRILRPRFALLENVPGHLSLGFGQVLADLASIGYNTQWDCIPAASVGAPHLRDRIFVIATRTDMADTDGTRQQKQGGPRHSINTTTKSKRETIRSVNGRKEQGESYVADPDSVVMGQRRITQPHPTACRQWPDHRGRETPNDLWQWWQTEPDVGRVADGIPHRVDRLRGLGNAVVPQVAEHVGNIIMEMSDD